MMSRIALFNVMSWTLDSNEYGDIAMELRFMFGYEYNKDREKSL